MPSIRPVELFRESIRSVLARPVLSLLAGLVIGALLLGAALLETHALRSFQETTHQQIRSGANVLVVDANGALLPGRPCEALGRAGGVLDAGSLRSVSAVRIADGGAVSFQLATVSEGYLRVVAPTVRNVHAVVAGAAVSDALGVRAGSLMQLTDGRSLRVGMSMPKAMRTPDRDRWLFQIAPLPGGAEITECWIESKPGALDQTREQIVALFSATEGLRVRSLVSGDVGAAAQNLYEDRVSRWGWIPIAFICAGLVVIVLRARQPEYALYRIIGFSVIEVAVMFTYEAWLLMIPSGLAFLGAGVGYLASSGSLSIDTFSMMTSTFLLSLSAACLLIALVTPSLWRADLPRYLKGRG